MNESQRACGLRGAARGLLGAGRALCRVCLRAGEQLTALAQPLQLPEARARSAGDLLAEVGGCQVLPGDFANSLCISCYSSLISAYLFKRNCQHADEIINSVITQIDRNLDSAEKAGPETVVVFNLPKKSLEIKNKKEFKILLSNYRSHTKVKNIVTSEKNMKNHNSNGSVKRFINTAKRHRSYTNDKKDMLCVDCGKYFASARKYYDHVSLHRRKYECAHCFKWFPRKTTLIRHCKDVHLKVRNSYMCDHCGSLLATKYTLKEHLKLHDAKYCDGCQKMFDNATIFNSHTCPTQALRKKSKPNTRPVNYHYCDHCDYKTKKKHTLGLHINQWHFKSNAYQCDICNKNFYQKIRLIKHKETHEKLRPEKCDVCSKNFVNKKALLYHTRLHTGERPYECNVCGEKFISQNRERTHFKNSHMEKTVKCPQCVTMFHTNTQFRNHFDKIHLNNVKAKKKKGSTTKK